MEFVILSLWDALYDERPGLSFVSHSLSINFIDKYDGHLNYVVFSVKIKVKSLCLTN
jgi:hypothetical protein